MPGAVDRRERNASWWVKAFVPFHILAITAWSLPPPVRESSLDEPYRWDSIPAVARSISRGILDGSLGYNERYVKPSFIRFYALSTGFWQYWDMFAPNPSDTDLWGSATVHYRDGTSKVYAYPRIYDMPIPEKYLMERYRKFFERASNDGFKYLWVPFARRVARLNDLPGNPVVRVELTRHWMVLPGPGKPMPDDYQTYTYLTWEVPASEQGR